MSILDEAVESQNLEFGKNRFLRALLTGDSGTGKTLSALTVPGRKRLVDLDNRSESVAGLDIYGKTKVNVIGDSDPDRPKAWFKCIELNNELWKLANQKKLEDDILIIDGITSLCKYAMNWALKLTTSEGQLMSTGPGGAPAQPHYPPMMYELTQFVFSVLTLPMHVIFTAHLDLYEDKKLETLTYYPKITGKLRTECASWFNETYLCHTKRVSGVTKYYWQTKGGGQRYPFMKSGLNKFGKVWADPVEINFDEPSTGFKKLIELTEQYERRKKK